MQMTSSPFWLRIVSTRIAVFPVERSPMISSRWPRPTFVIESIALIPVWSGSFTGWRAITPGALNSSWRRSSDSIGGPPSSGFPSGSTTRPSSPSPTGTLATSPVRRTGSPSLTSSHSPKRATPTLSSSRLKAMPTTPCSNSSSSSATQFSSPCTRAMPSPIWRTLPTSERSVWTSYCSIRDLRIEVISSGRSFTWRSLLWRCGGRNAKPGCLPAHELVPEGLEPAFHARVDAHRAGLEDDAADQVRIDLPRRFDRAARRLLDLAQDGARLLVRELDRGRQLDVEPALLGRHERVQLLLDLLELAGTAFLDSQQDEVAHELVRAAQDLLDDARLLARVELRVGERAAELGHGRQRGDEVAQLLVGDGEPLLLARGLEEGARVHAVGD